MQLCNLTQKLITRSISKKRTEPRAKIGKEQRDIGKKVGVFKDMMSRPPLKAVLPHPKF